jgi:transposase
VDETGHTFRAAVGRTWAPRGQPPILRRLSQRREVSSIAALVAPLDGPARLYARHFHGSVHGAQVREALRYFRRRIGRPLVVIWDGLAAHRAAPVLAFVAAHPEEYQLVRLPAYAPELNPEELCNAAVKQELLNAAPDSVDGLQQAARRSFRRLGHRPNLLHGFFEHTGIPVN